MCAGRSGTQTQNCVVRTWFFYFINFDWVQRGVGMEVSFALPRPITSASFSLLAFKRVPSEQRLIIYLDGQQVFFVMGFDPPRSRSRMLYVGCPPLYSSTVGSHLLVAHVSFVLRPLESHRPQSFALPALSHASHAPLAQLLALVEAIKHNSPLPESLFAESFLAFAQGDEERALFLCAVALARAQEGDAILCSFA
jgi:hypothetical protein